MSDADDKRCLRFYVSGRVQGVFFRAATRRQALQLDLTGYARNLPDGGVEVVACGEFEALKALQAWLWQGPPNARVESVDCEPYDDRERQGFEIG